MEKCRWQLFCHVLRTKMLKTKKHGAGWKQRILQGEERVQLHRQGRCGQSGAGGQSLPPGAPTPTLHLLVLRLLHLAEFSLLHISGLHGGLVHLCLCLKQAGA